MYEYKFTTVIPKSGIIVLPTPNPLFGKEVEITITSHENIPLPKPSFDEFISKWLGFLKNDSNDNKLECSDIHT